MTELQEGTIVRYFPGFRDGPSHLGKIRHEGLRQVGGTDGYYVSGAGFISAAHIEVLEMPREGTIKVSTAAEALEVCDFDGITDVVITDQMERVKMQKLIRGFR